MLSQRTFLDVVFAATAATTSLGMIVAINNSKMSGTAFAAHPMFMATGFSLVASAGFLMAHTPQRNGRMVKMHQATMVLGNAALYYGLWVIYNVKVANKKKHLQSTHSLIAVTAVSASTVLACTTLFLRREGGDKQTRDKFMNYHPLLGKIAPSLLMCAVVTGTMQAFDKAPETRNFLAGSAIAAVATLLLISAARPQPPPLPARSSAPRPQQV
jgi:cytochrome bd-type quinol oxidase subunit 2